MFAGAAALTTFVAALGVGVIVYGESLAGKNVKTAAPAATPAAAAAAKSEAAAPVANGKVEVTASDFKFGPAKLSLAGPGELAVTLKNAGMVEHDITVDGVGKVYAKAQQTANGTLKFDKAGSYSFYCSIPGHKDAGMVGTIQIGAEAAAAPAAASAAAPAAAAPQEQPKPADPAAKPLPPPAIAPPIARNEPALVKYEVETTEVTAKLADGQTYTFWTFGGSVPGPMLRVQQGDTVELTLKNAINSSVTHSIDLHAVTGPGGGAKVTQVAPGESATFKFQALNPGVYVYHCATPMVAHHISNGMYGLIVVEPPGGLTKVDREYYVMEGDVYLKGNRTLEGQREFSVDKMLDERADYVLFNGGVGQLVGDKALKAKVGETIRIFFGVGGPNVTSSFHVIGEIFDKVYPEGGSVPNTNVQTTFVPAGGATVVEFKAEVPGTYTIVDHSLGRLEKGAAGQIVVEGAANPTVFETIHAGSAGGGGH
jgi:nitrite reductase (NO-forming)